MANPQQDNWNQRWGFTDDSDGYMPFPAAFRMHYSQIGITSEEAMFVLHVIAYKWDERDPYPSFETIASEMGKTRTTVQGYARKLEHKGFMKRIARIGKSSELDFSGLVNAINILTPCKDIDTLSENTHPPVQIHTPPCVNLHTEEDKERRRSNKIHVVVVDNSHGASDVESPKAKQKTLENLIEQYKLVIGVKKDKSGKPIKIPNPVELELAIQRLKNKFGYDVVEEAITNIACWDKPIDNAMTFLGNGCSRISRERTRDKPTGDCNSDSAFTPEQILDRNRTLKMLEAKKHRQLAGDGHG